MFDTNTFIKDRNEAFLSKDKEKILAYCEKYGIKFPEEEEAFWAGVHKAICNLFLMEDTPVTIDQYNESYDWLAERGYSPLINNTGGEK